jgi:hypothetical protein
MPRLDPATDLFLAVDTEDVKSAREQMVALRCAADLGSAEFRVNLFYETLVGEQRRVLEKLGAVAAARGFYLAGGTAIALQLGHRESVDLDWFTQERIPNPELLAGLLKEDGIDFKMGATGREALHGTVKGVRVSFIHYPYPTQKEKTQSKGGEFYLASLDDLAAIKLSTVSQRGHRKDFVDIYALGEKHAPFPDLLKQYCLKFKVDNAPQVFYGLSYFVDAENTVMPRMLWPVKWPAIKKTILSWVHKAGQRPKKEKEKR